MTEKAPLILITGASGYVGGRLLRELIHTPNRLRAMARRPEGLETEWKDQIDVVQADVLKPETLGAALEGVEIAYYLIHSMGGGSGFEEREATSARNFGTAAKKAGVKLIIFLGGLSDDAEELSPHMRSRHQTGEILRQSGVPVVEFRASIILGAGSLSFEMIRALVQRLPIMVTPKWAYVEAQPISVDDLLKYLVQALKLPAYETAIYEIGGADVVSYKDVMSTYAEERGLKRYFLPVPVLSPYLSSLWLGLVTPLFARVGRKLIESVTHASVVQTELPKGRFDVNPCGLKEAISRSLDEEDQGYATTRWSDSLSAGNTLKTWAGVRFGTRLVDSRAETTKLPPKQVFKAIEAIGGETGWYYGNFLWGIRGGIDELLGGVGMRRSRRHPENLRVGDVLDCWRVQTIEPGKQLELKAEMKLPGRAWLEFELIPSDASPDETILRQTATYDPKGLLGLLYWYGIYPVHVLVFKGMLRGILRQAESLSGKK